MMNGIAQSAFPVALLALAGLVLAWAHALVQRSVVSAVDPDGAGKQEVLWVKIWAATVAGALAIGIIAVATFVALETNSRRELPAPNCAVKRLTGTLGPSPSQGKGVVQTKHAFVVTCVASAD